MLRLIREIREFRKWRRNRTPEAETRCEFPFPVIWGPQDCMCWLTRKGPRYSVGKRSCPTCGKQPTKYVKEE